MRAHFIFSLLISVLSSCNQPDTASISGSYWMYVSSNATDKSNAGIGIYKWNIEKGTLEFEATSKVESSSSYLTIDPDNSRLYSINTNGISSFQINLQNGKLDLINKKAITGQGPCYISIAKNKKYLMLAYYVSGDIATYELVGDGVIGKEISKINHLGSSITERQESAHPHMIVPAPTGDLLFVADLGTDLVYTYAVSDAGEIATEPKSITMLPAGFGPRHLAFHPSKPIVYVLGELAAEVIGYKYDDKSGATTKISQVKTLPESFNEFNKSADIHISSNGKKLYASNRGHNSIAIFTIDEQNGALALEEIVPSGGEWPRAFELDPSGQFMLIANKRSNSINVIPIADDNELSKKGTEYKSVSSPQCIRFITVAREY